MSISSMKVVPFAIDQDAKSVDFFHDFIVFLKHLKKHPIQRTLILGNISLHDITNLKQQFLYSTHTDEVRKEMDWQIRVEDDVEYLTQMKIIAEVMHLTYKRRRQLILSKNGSGYLDRLRPLEQYTEMVLHFWYRANWAYFNLGKEIRGRTLTEILQDYQNNIWQIFLKNGEAWMDYRGFCLALETHLNLYEYFKDEYGDPQDNLLFDINLSLFRKNLLRFGIIEVEEGQKEKWKLNIKRFRPTPLGLHVFKKALCHNFLQH